jgi:hypothetical protein
MHARSAIAALAIVALAPLQEATAWAAKIEDPQGTAVSFTSTRTDTEIFLAKGNPPSDVYPDPFERVGTAPITVHLAPGRYTVETASASTSRGREHFIVGTEALTLDVHPGDVLPKTIGICLEALGVVAIGLGIVALVQFGPHDSGYDRWAVGLPIMGGGVAAVGVGIGLNLVGVTRIIIPTASAQGLGFSFVQRF